MRGFSRVLVLTLLGLLVSPVATLAQNPLWGTIFSLSPGQPPRLVLQVDRRLVPITILPTTLIQIRNQAGQLVTIAFADLRVADEVTITVTPKLEATAMTVVGRSITALPAAPTGSGPTPPGASPSQPPATTPSPSAQSDIAVTVPEGVFVLRNLRITPRDPRSDSIVVGLEGEVVNRTTKLWTQAEFEVTLYDSAGGKVGNVSPGGGPFTFTARHLAIGRPKKVQEPSFGAIPSGTTVASLQVTFRRGTYPAAYVFDMVKPAESAQSVFEDARLRIAFSLTREMIEFTLKNKASVPLRIDWNRVTYVDPAGKAQRVIHKGVGFNDRDRPQASTVVPPGATIKDVVLPTGHVVSGTGWVPLFPEGPAAHEYVGKSFRIVMPIELGGTVHPYTFEFRVRQVKS